LHFDIGRTIGRARAAAAIPGITDQALDEIEFGLLKHFSFVNGLPSDDQIQHASILWGTADVIQTRLKFFCG
jgi:hypothetical protein